MNFFFGFIFKICGIFIHEILNSQWFTHAFSEYNDVVDCLAHFNIQRALFKEVNGFPSYQFS